MLTGMKKEILLSLLLFFLVVNLHSQNAEEIVFSSQTIDPGKPVELTNQFNSGDAIYAVAYFSNTLQEIAEAKPTSIIQAEVFVYAIRPPLYSYQQPSTEELAYSAFWISGKALQNNYLIVDLAPNPNATTSYGNGDLLYKKFGQKFDGPVLYAESFAKLKSGKNKLRILVKCNYKDIASGEFTIYGADFGFYEKLAEELNLAAGKMDAGKALMPKSAMVNESLKLKMITALKNSQTFRERMSGEVLRLVIIDPDWTIRRNELTGAILHRYIRAAAAVKDKEGNCARYDLITFQEDYVGGKFQPLKFDGVGDKTAMDCANVNK
jgi:hypothetical protein